MAEENRKIKKSGRAPPVRFGTAGRTLQKSATEGHDERVNRDRLGERHTDNADGKDVTEGTGVATHGLSGGHTDEADADAGAGTRDGEGEVSVECSGGGAFSGGSEGGDDVDLVNS